MQPQNPEMNNLPNGEPDHEGAMARADLYKLANYSLKLFKQMEDNAQLESWVQAKITKAADYIASVYHYMEYEMKFSDYAHHLDNSDTISESQKTELKNKLMEAKSKVSELKKAQAEKQTGIKKDIASDRLERKAMYKEEVSKDARDEQPTDDFDEKIGETMAGSKEDPCPTCHGTGHVAKPERKVPEALKAKVAAYNRKAKAMSAAVKRVDANKNGIPDDMEDQEVEEDFEGLNKTGDTAKTSKGGTVTKTAKGIKHEPDASKFTDEPHTEPKSIAKSRSAAEKSGDKAADKEQTKKSKDWSKRFGKDSVTKVSAGKKVDPNAPKEKEVDETYGQGVYEGKKKKPDFLDMDKDGNKKEPMKKAVSDKKKNPFAKKVDEAQKGDDVVNKAEKMRIAKGTGTGIKGAIKDVVSGLKGEKPAHVNESAELDRMKQFLTRLNG